MKLDDGGRQNVGITAEGFPTCGGLPDPQACCVHHLTVEWDGSI